MKKRKSVKKIALLSSFFLFFIIFIYYFHFFEVYFLWDKKYKKKMSKNKVRREVWETDTVIIRGREERGRRRRAREKDQKGNKRTEIF